MATATSSSEVVAEVRPTGIMRDFEPDEALDQTLNLTTGGQSGDPAKIWQGIQATQRATQIAARGRSARVRQCPWIFQAPTMPAAIGTKNKIRTRVERREKLPNSLPP